MSEAAVSGQSVAPDWALVPFAVGCARCGEDLRGRSEPVCPACGLTFNWADAAPIERLTCHSCGYHLMGLTQTRCPECGKGFSWETVLDDYRRRQKPLFEYRWRTEPVRSLVRTWWLACRPWKLWRMVELHDPPKVGPLIALVIIGLVLSIAVPLGVGYGGDALVAYINTKAPPPRGPSFLPFGGGLMDFPKRIDLVVPLRSTPWWLGMRGMICLFLWCAGSLLSLLLLRQSMRRCRVRTVHVFRVWVLSLLPLYVLPLMYCGMMLLAIATEATLGLGMDYVQWRRRPHEMWLMPLWMVLAVGLGFRHYVRMTHAWWVATTAQTIALILVFTVWPMMFLYWFADWWQPL